MGKRVDLTGQKFGRLTVLEFAGHNKHGSALWKCRCDCGNYKIAATKLLRDGHTSSCGCYRKEVSKRLNTIHGIRYTRINRIYSSMKQRCYNPKCDEYYSYGGRGISVCQEWKDSVVSFAEWAYQNGYSDNLTLDRINVNGNYEPSNCRWVSIKVQANNKTNNVYHTINGIAKTLPDWCDYYGVPYKIVKGRIDRGWDTFTALTTPKLRSNGKYYFMASMNSR